MAAQFISPELAFDHAVSLGYLSRDADSDLFTGRFRYVETDEGCDIFKNAVTSELLKVPRKGAPD